MYHEYQYLSMCIMSCSVSFEGVICFYIDPEEGDHEEVVKHACDKHADCMRCCVVYTNKEDKLSEE